MRIKRHEGAQGKGKEKFDMETLEFQIIWVNGTHATLNPARRIRGQRR